VTKHKVIHYEDGRFRVPTLEPVTLDQYLRHAHKFGTECVYETAEMSGLSKRDLALLRIELDDLEARKRGERFSIGKRRKRSREETQQAVELLSVAGLTRKEIGGKLGLSDKTVDNYFGALA
jgi:DNA-binding NarL/FixJ family response regulator